MTRQEIILDLKKAERILWKTGVLLKSKPGLETPFPIISNPTPLWQYMLLIKNENYTFLLKDGSVIQMGFEFGPDDRIKKHKLAFFQSPLPHVIDPNDYLFSPDDVVSALEMLMDRKFWGGEISPEPDPGKDFPLIYSFRVDYDESGPDNIDHPKSHATVFSQNCRIASNTYFDVRTFLLLIFGNLWPEYGKRALKKLQQIARRTSARNPSLLPRNYSQFYGAYLSL